MNEQQENDIKPNSLSIFAEKPSKQVTKTLYTEFNKAKKELSVSKAYKTHLQGEIEMLNPKVKICRI